MTIYQILGVAMMIAVMIFFICMLYRAFGDWTGVFQVIGITAAISAWMALAIFLITF